MRTTALVSGPELLASTKSIGFVLTKDLISWSALKYQVVTEYIFLDSKFNQEIAVDGSVATTIFRASISPSWVINLFASIRKILVFRDIFSFGILAAS